MPSAFSSPPGAVFLSDSPEGKPGPRLRLTYRSEGPETLTLAFNIAAPGKNFANHVHARLQKKK